MDWIDNIGRFLIFGWLAYVAFSLLREIIGGFHDRLSREPSRPNPKSNLPDKQHQEINSAIGWQTVQVAGVSYSNSNGTSRQVSIRKWPTTEKIWLERDVMNVHDRNAIKVVTEYGQLGFLPRTLSAKLEKTNLDLIQVRGGSKGPASNGLYGCSIQLKISTADTNKVEKAAALTTPVLAHKILSEKIPPPAESFKKEAALLAARSGKLTHIQLIGIIDRARDLKLTSDECAAFEAALENSAPPSVKSKVRQIKKPIFSEARYCEGDSYEDTCPICLGAQELYDQDNDRYSKCYRCGGSGYD